MEKYENLGITSTVTNDKLKIEISISGLINGFNLSPDNFEETKVKRGKRQEFAKYIAQQIIDMSDPDTGNSPVMTMFDKVFSEVFEGNEYDDEIFKYTEEEY